MREHGRGQRPRATARQQAPIRPAATPARCHQNATGTVIPSVEPTAAARVRPGAESNAYRLAPTGVSDPDAREGWAAYQRGELNRPNPASARCPAGVGTLDPLHARHVEATHWRSFAKRLMHGSRCAPAPRTSSRVHGSIRSRRALQLKDFDRAIRTARLVSNAGRRTPTSFRPWASSRRCAVHSTMRSSRFRRRQLWHRRIRTFISTLARRWSCATTSRGATVDQLRAWVSNEAERAAAIANCKRYLTMNGVYGDSAAPDWRALGGCRRRRNRQRYFARAFAANATFGIRASFHSAL